MNNYKGIVVLFFLLTANISASTVDTVITYSPSMKKEIKAVVILPDSYSCLYNLPVLYLLHGSGGNYASLINIMPVIKTLSDNYNIIIICPDGGGRSWYFDSPVDSLFKYETYVSRELVDWIDNHYKTIKNRNGRAITGISMRGHGALYLAFKHQDLYGAAGSIMGGVDFRPFPDEWDLKYRLGPQSEYPENWDKNTVISQISKLSPNSIKFMFDCGTEDFFYPANCRLHQELLYWNIPHDFITRPGKHDYEYVNNSIFFQALFFNEFFTKSTDNN